MQRIRARWNGQHSGLVQEPDFSLRGAAPRGIPEGHDLVAGLLAEDARSAGHELWLGLQLAAAAVALLAAGIGIPLLALAFAAAPIIGCSMEIFAGQACRRD